MFYLFRKTKTRLKGGFLLCCHHSDNIIWLDFVGIFNLLVRRSFARWGERGNQTLSYCFTDSRAIITLLTPLKIGVPTRIRTEVYGVNLDSSPAWMPGPSSRNSVIIFTTCLSQCILAHSAMSRDRTKMFIHGLGGWLGCGDCARGWAACQYPHHQYGQKLYFISDVTFFRLLIMSKTSSLL